MCANCQLKKCRQWIVTNITLVTICCRQKTVEEDKEAKCQVSPRPITISWEDTVKWRKQKLLPQTLFSFCRKCRNDYLIIVLGMQNTKGMCFVCKIDAIFCKKTGNGLLTNTVQPSKSANHFYYYELQLDVCVFTTTSLTNTDLNGCRNNHPKVAKMSPPGCCCLQVLCLHRSAPSMGQMKRRPIDELNYLSWVQWSQMPEAAINALIQYSVELIQMLLGSCSERKTGRIH